jgi:hypothetical protein
MKMELPVELSTSAIQCIGMVTGLEIGQQKKQDPNRPSLILQRAGDLCLWDLAKRTGSTVEAIRRVNGLEQEPAPDQMLLIPIA